MAVSLHNGYRATPFGLAECQVASFPSKPAHWDRFWAKVRLADGGSACWLWQGARLAKYGGFSIDNYPHYAHRVAYSLTRGGQPIPAGLFVLHSCDNTLCVNPYHLSLGTQTDNMRDASRKGRLSLPRKANRALIAEIQTRWLAGGVTQAHLAAEYGKHEVQICRWLKPVKESRTQQRQAS